MNASTQPLASVATPSEAANTATQHLKSAGEHLQTAARKAATALPEVNAAATKALKEGYADVAPELAAAKQEALEAGSAAVANSEQAWRDIVSQGKSVLERSEQFVRERPLASVGLAVAGGYLLSRLIRR